MPSKYLSLVDELNSMHQNASRRLKLANLVHNLATSGFVIVHKRNLHSLSEAVGTCSFSIRCATSGSTQSFC